MFADKLDVRANNTILYLASHSLCVAFSMAQAKLCTGCLEPELVQVASNNFHKQQITIMHYMIQNMNMEIHRI
jgi:hypothetical protein